MSPELRRLLSYLLKDDTYNKPKRWDDVMSEALEAGIFLQTEQVRGNCRIWFIDNPDKVKELLRRVEG